MTQRQYTEFLKRWSRPCADLVRWLAAWTSGESALSLDAVRDDIDALRDALDKLDHLINDDCPF